MYLVQQSVSTVVVVRTLYLLFYVLGRGGISCQSENSNMERGPFHLLSTPAPRRASAAHRHASSRRQVAFAVPRSPRAQTKSKNNTPADTNTQRLTCTRCEA